jgi:hypothetical protein
LEWYSHKNTGQTLQCPTDKRTNNDPQNIHRNLKIEKNETHNKPVMNFDAPEG